MSWKTSADGRIIQHWARKKSGRNNAFVLLFMIVHSQGGKVKITLDYNDTPRGDSNNTCSGYIHYVARHTMKEKTGALLQKLLQTV